jgi:hypothetical protein
MPRVLQNEPNFGLGTLAQSATRKVTPQMGVTKISWEKVGRVTEPGRYMYTFGWLTITAEDIDIWSKFPRATFTLVTRPSTEASLGEDEFCLGSFDISPEA